jgi:hypothetical protein
VAPAIGWAAAFHHRHIRQASLARRITPQRRLQF